jgi:hypothetical protein
MQWNGLSHIFTALSLSVVTLECLLNAIIVALFSSTKMLVTFKTLQQKNFTLEVDPSLKVHIDALAFAK